MSKPEIVCVGGGVEVSPRTACCCQNGENEKLSFQQPISNQEELIFVNIVYYKPLHIALCKHFLIFCCCFHIWKKKRYRFFSLFDGEKWLLLSNSCIEFTIIKKLVKGILVITYIIELHTVVKITYCYHNQNFSHLKGTQKIWYNLFLILLIFLIYFSSKCFILKLRPRRNASQIS